MANILFIHPDHKLCGIYHRHLSEHFSIDSAHDGLMGLRKIKETRPKMIISEYRLPFMSGLALLEYVRKHPDMRDAPFLFLTNEEMREDALGLGANAWLKLKEHGPEQLLPHIASHYKFLVNY